jgi:pimeloyl-ACP methyl ester carboxylesterase
MPGPNVQPSRETMGSLIQRPEDLRSSDGVSIPAFYVRDERQPSDLGLVWFHGYSGSKVRSVGLALTLAEHGFPTLVPDLRGHGEHPASFDEKTIEEAEVVVRWMRTRYKKVVSIGSSLGGLLAGVSSADFVVALSPPLTVAPSAEGRYLLRLGSFEVREAQPDILGRLLKGLAERWRGVDPQRLLILYGRGEPREIVKGIEEWAMARNANAVCVTDGQLPESEGPPGLVRYLPHWLNHAALSSVAVSKDLLTGALDRQRAPG